MKTFDVRDYGASGRKADIATPAIQRAVDACAEAGGGMVYVPPGEYTVGMIRLRSHVRFHLEAGATLFSSKNRADFDERDDNRLATFFGENLENVSIEGRGTVDGQAEYEWKVQDFDDRYIKENLDEFLKTGKQPLRAFPLKNQYGRLVLLLKCTDVRVEGVSFIRSPSWTMNYYACRRLVIDGVYIRSSLKAGVWADGIDPDGCSDVRISNCTIETGDDAIVFYSTPIWGPALPCENITVTNCRLSSASSAIKFCDGNNVAVRNVVIDNCVITDSNRGIAFMTFDGGNVEDVVISNCTIDCRRFDWFWWGDGDPIYFMARRRYSELHPEMRKEEPPAGAIRRVLLKDIIAHGKARCLLRGHPENWLENIRMSDVRLFLTADPKADYNKEGSGLTVRYARDVQMHNVEVVLGEPTSPKWRSALSFEDAADVLVDGFRGTLPKGSKEPAIALKNVKGAVVRNSRVVPGSGTLLVAGVGTKDIVVGSGVMPMGDGVEGEATAEKVAVRRPGAGKPAARKKGAPGRKAPAGAKKSAAARAKPSKKAAAKAPKGKKASKKPRRRT